MIRAATYARHYAEPPQREEADGCPTWITRAANFVVVVTKGRAGTILARPNNADEYMLILPPGCSATVTAGSDHRDVSDDTLTIVPPGESAIRLSSPGIVLRIFSHQASDLCAAAANQDQYLNGAPEVRPLVPWPDPVGGFRIRTYALADYAIPDGPQIQPRIFRSTNMMVNVFVPWHAVRDTARLSPHWHDDLEQATVTLEGDFIHDIRTPWGPDLTAWRPDEHVEISSPSATIIPVTLVHTLRNPNTSTARAVDVFAPPRFDFSRRPGMVLNADEYPMPDKEAEWSPPKVASVAWQSTSKT